MIQWEYSVLKTNAPPTQEELQERGDDGHDLVSIIYSEREGQWVTYLKKQVNPSSTALDQIPF